MESTEHGSILQALDAAQAFNAIVDAGEGHPTLAEVDRYRALFETYDREAQTSFRARVLGHLALQLTDRGDETIRGLLAAVDAWFPLSNGGGGGNEGPKEHR